MLGADAMGEDKLDLADILGATDPATHGPRIIGRGPTQAAVRCAHRGPATDAPPVELREQITFVPMKIEIQCDRLHTSDLRNRRNRLNVLFDLRVWSSVAPVLRPSRSSIANAPRWQLAAVSDHKPGAYVGDCALHRALSALACKGGLATIKFRCRRPDETEDHPQRTGKPGHVGVKLDR